MNRSPLKRVAYHLLAFAALAVMCSAMAQEAAPGQRSDGQIEMDVVHALDASQALKNDLITAATIQSEVTLSGTVSSDASKQLAESIVKGVPGVTGVHNNLKVGNPANDPNAQGANLNEQNAPDVADNQPGTGPEPPSAEPVPDYGQNQPPAYSQNPPTGNNQAQPPAYGQVPPDYGQNQPPGYGQAPPPPDYGQAPPPGYGQNQPPYGQAPPPGYGQNQPPYGQAPPPGYGQNQYPPPQYRQQYAPPQPTYALPKGPMTVPEGTLVQLRTSEPVGSKNAKDGTPVQFMVIQDVAIGGVLAIPRGATVNGVVSELKRPGALAGDSELALQLTSLDLGGQNYPLQSDQFKVKGPNKAGRTAESAIGGALMGAIIGGAVGRGPGAAIGAAAGAGAGTAASAASAGPGVWIPAEALVTFHLSAPVTVNPISRDEAARLSQGLYQGGPSLYRRPGYGYPYRPYGYAPVFYRPYYMMGGYYYWR